MKLKYFNFTGRGETIRILLHGSVGTEWTDTRIPFSDWMTVKDATPLGAIPTLTIDNTEFCQSCAIQRYLAKKVNMYPDDDPFKALIVDEVMDILNESLFKLPSPYEVPAEEFKQKRTEYVYNTLTPYLTLVEARIQQFGISNNTICGIPSVADIYLMVYLDTFMSGSMDHIDPDTFTQFPNILAVKEQISKHPIVKSYYDSVTKDN